MEQSAERGAAERGAAPTAWPSDGPHPVGFYENEEFLVDRIVDFVLPALWGDEAVLLVATAIHLQEFEAAVTARGLDVASVVSDGRLTMVDVAGLRAQVTTDGALDGQQVKLAASELFAPAAVVGRTLYVYGDTSAVLWADGDTAGALELESLCDELVATYPHVRMMCAYPMHLFDSADSADRSRHCASDTPASSQVAASTARWPKTRTQPRIRHHKLPVASRSRRIGAIPVRTCWQCGCVLAVVMVVCLHGRQHR